MTIEGIIYCIIWLSITATVGYVIWKKMRDIKKKED